ncbi:hypothetical protein PIB30_010382 [Stylosanthes scabra]|uniref:Uncharacterized protein n=1 Tax=Stylosanthes scabra TaxID=79078 RepID=A0ABU6W8Z6_9FABA|nr:hypothetical protein [Stylosanthes scabra]
MSSRPMHRNKVNPEFSFLSKTRRYCCRGTQMGYVASEERFSSKKSVTRACNRVKNTEYGTRVVLPTRPKIKRKSPNPALTARPHPPDGAPAAPLLNGEVSVGGAPARSRRCGRATLFRNAQDKDTARPRDSSRTHLNEGYFGDFTFPDQSPSLSQAQFDLYGGEQLKHNKHSLISSILAIE